MLSDLSPPAVLLEPRYLRILCMVTRLPANVLIGVLVSGHGCC